MGFISIDSPKHAANIEMSLKLGIMKREAPEFSPSSDSFLAQIENSSPAGFLQLIFAAAVWLLPLVLLSLAF